MTHAFASGGADLVAAAASVAQRALHDMAADDAMLFDVAPVSMWIEDGSKLLALFTQWRAHGVTSFHDHLSAHPDALYDCVSAVQVVRVNAKTLRQFEVADFDELVGNLPRIFGDRALADMMHTFENLWDGGLEFSCETVNYTAAGRKLDVQIWGCILPGHEKDWKRFLLVIEDLTQRENARRAAAASEMYARQLFEHSPSALWVQDYSGIAQLFAALRATGVRDLAAFMAGHPGFVDQCVEALRVVDVNHRTLELYGASSKGQFFGHIGQVLGDGGKQSFRLHLIDLWKGDLEQRREVVNQTLAGACLHLQMSFSIFPGHEREWSLAVVAMADITDRKLAEERLEYLGTHDELSGLYNRSFYSRMLASFDREGVQPVTVVSLDLNELKRMNDAHGHAAGDALISRAGEVLAACLCAVERASAMRIGGDEFVVLMPGADVAQGERMLERIEVQVAANNALQPGATLSFSLGTATSHAGEAMASVVQRADAMMYRDKRAFYRKHGENERRKARNTP